MSIPLIVARSTRASACCNAFSARALILRRTLKLDPSAPPILKTARGPGNVGPWGMGRGLASLVHASAPGGFMMPNDFTNDKGKKFFSKLGIKFSSRRKLA